MTSSNKFRASGALVRKFLSSRLIGLLGSAVAISASTAGGAQTGFTLAEAQAYLSQQPTGPRAAEAFQVIVDASLSNRYPEFSPQEIASGNASSQRGDISQSAIDLALDQLSSSAADRNAALEAAALWRDSTRSLRN